MQARKQLLCGYNRRKGKLWITEDANLSQTMPGLDTILPEEYKFEEKESICDIMYLNWLVFTNDFTLTKQ